MLKPKMGKLTSYRCACNKHCNSILGCKIQILGWLSVTNKRVKSIADSVFIDTLKLFGRYFSCFESVRLSLVVRFSYLIRTFSDHCALSIAFISFF